LVRDVLDRIVAHSAPRINELLPACWQLLREAEDTVKV
jgi:hypothetical protein